MEPLSVHSVGYASWHLRMVLCHLLRNQEVSNVTTHKDMRRLRRTLHHPPESQGPVKVLSGLSAEDQTEMTANQALTGPNYVHTFRVYPKPDPDDEPWPDEATATIRPRMVKPKLHGCEWCGRRQTTNPDRICDLCRPEWRFQRDRMAKGDYPMETKGTA